MKKDLNAHLMRILYTGHKHAEITEWIQCKVCGEKFDRWQKERDKLRTMYPKDFIRYQKKWKPSATLREKWEHTLFELNKLHPLIK